MIKIKNMTKVLRRIRDKDGKLVKLEAGETKDFKPGDIPQGILKAIIADQIYRVTADSDEGEAAIAAAKARRSPGGGRLRAVLTPDKTARAPVREPVRVRDGLADVADDEGTSPPGGQKEDEGGGETKKVELTAAEKLLGEVDTKEYRELRLEAKELLGDRWPHGSVSRVEIRAALEQLIKDQADKI